ncbi:MAG: Ldh family oxidoreductase [Phycisphaeraceae bacterium]|nr:Ldh family oxidoreductase [Phycisphaeraceae bacterium]
MVQIKVNSHQVDWESLRLLACQILCKNGLTQQDATLVADSLVQANLRGIDSHGIARLPHYLNRMKHGSIKPTPNMTLTQVASACAILDGDHGLGQMVMAKASDEAVSLARKAGAGWVSVRNSSHCGALAHYGLQIAKQGMIGLVFTHVDPMVLPHGSKEPFCGTNPLCIAVAGQGDEHLCLDMATSVVPWNTVANAAHEGVPIPKGWAVDKDGIDITQASRVAALYPFGGYKGSGLGLLIDMLCSLLGGSPYGPDIPKMYGDPSQHRQLGGLVGAIDLSHFIDTNTAQKRVSEMIDRWGNLQPAETGGQVQYPGQPEVQERQRRIKNGVPIGHELFKTLNDLAQAYEIDHLTHQP